MSELQPQREHVVLLVHGIRTTARWIGMVKETLEYTSSGRLKVEPVSYGVFSLWRFVLPGPWRQAAVKTVARYIRAVRARDNDLTRPPERRRHISVIAHSFGTYCIFRALDKNSHLRLYRVILCGSVLPQNFEVERYEAQLGPSKVLNECGDRDPWPLIAKKITIGYGSSGTFGLFSERVANRFHRTAHSDYFDAEFVADMWRPFLENGELKPSDWDRRRANYRDPLLIRVLNTVPLGAAALLMLGVGGTLAFGPELRKWLPSDSCFTLQGPEAVENADSWGQEVGGDGGRPFGPLTCQSGESLVGLYGKAGSEQDARVFSVGPICAGARFGQANEFQLQFLGAPDRRDDVGSDDGKPFQLTCPPGTIVTGSQLDSAPFNTGSAYLLSQITLRCSSVLRPTNPAMVKSVTNPGPVLSFAARQPFSCPDGSAGFGIKGRTGQWIDALSIGCRQVQRILPCPSAAKNAPVLSSKTTESAPLRTTWNFTL